jgi:tubby-related protein 1
MTVLLPSMAENGQRNAIISTTEKNGIVERFKAQDNQLIALHNKSPIWNPDTQSYFLNFHGRVTKPSIKNFQIVHDQGNWIYIYDYRLGLCDYAIWKD